ncbi:hypothetical protein [Bradyrhizobium sp. CSS354]|uniref:hypothetical protein n=1 Tax=Bradyrhizobium sp. CSS354 TaxID=2699172 RepID=UPI0023AF8091|nr:hypothetical protein [Bradyrhizobium sp. CSS354]MDE5461154.1 hypothetical protein [Bradyrhizobium sp. CSS354]
MLHRPPSRRRTRASQREQWRAAKRRQRQRETEGIKRSTITYDAVVIEAVIAQGEDARMSEDEAGKQSRNRKKVAAILADVVEKWARTYLAERARRHA